MQNRFGLLDTDVMPIFMIIALDIVITLSFSINCSIVICLPTECFLSRERPLVKHMPPGSIFHLISFRSIILVSYLFYFAIFTFQSIQQKYQKYLLYYLHYISLLRVSVKGLTTPHVGCKVLDCLCRYEGLTLLANFHDGVVSGNIANLNLEIFLLV